MNTLEKLEFKLRDKGIPSTIVVENDDNAIVYVRSLFIVQDKIVGINAYDRDTYIALNINGTELTETLDIDKDIDIDNFLSLCNKLINNNLDKIMGEEVR